MDLFTLLVVAVLCINILQLKDALWYRVVRGEWPLNYHEYKIKLQENEDLYKRLLLEKNKLQQDHAKAEDDLKKRHHFEKNWLTLERERLNQDMSKLIDKMLSK